MLGLCTPLCGAVTGTTLLVSHPGLPIPYLQATMPSDQCHQITKPLIYVLTNSGSPEVAPLLLAQDKCPAQLGATRTQWRVISLWA